MHIYSIIDCRVSPAGRPGPGMIIGDRSCAVARPETPPSPASRMIQAPGGFLENPQRQRVVQRPKTKHGAERPKKRIWKNLDLKMLALYHKNIWRLDIT